MENYREFSVSGRDLLVLFECVQKTWAELQTGLRVDWIQIQLRDIATYSTNILGICRVSERVIIYLDLGLASFNLLGIPQLRHENIDCTFLGFVARTIQNRDPKNNNFVFGTSLACDVENGLLAF